MGGNQSCSDNKPNCSTANTAWNFTKRQCCNTAATSCYNPTTCPKAGSTNCTYDASKSNGCK
uniref:Uncharacterized protein n=1 Tax=viral metagenome TaxID=1070528 RepID=A0A6C0CYV4_9ZZZZ